MNDWNKLKSFCREHEIEISHYVSTTSGFDSLKEVEEFIDDVSLVYESLYTHYCITAFINRTPDGYLYLVTLNIYTPILSTVKQDED